METVPATFTQFGGASTAQRATAGQGLDEMNSKEFMQLLIAELQNQDPLEPMSNQEMVQQIATIQEIATTAQLADTMNAVINGENLSTAAGLIGRAVRAISDQGDNVEGVVERVSVAVDEENRNQRTVKVHVGEHEIDLSNVRDILDGEQALETTPNA